MAGPAERAELRTHLNHVRGRTTRNPTLNTFRQAGRANIAYARHDLHDRIDAFAVYGI